ncbi:NAD(P)-dependent oxidoreductase [Leptolyngbya boryana CZ1]|uniref:NAD(P)-dependent oxidoreductase n=1 Tax=Leptolyngbya boryana CZ1 TaxID=3060204 RepID=A0AA97AR02_LEPBY|nr:NAD(P)-dependent oxidoreductase [Leptolyngbya boryana]WNZ46987.1 NAD(P)-dependent oxidoreductase [Leptolyngbya boryana CZ1]
MFSLFLRPRHSSAQKSVLLTGAAGRIGTALRQALGEQYHFRCFDRVRIPHAQDSRVADITNFKAVRKAMQGMEAVIHLAANPDIDQPWQDVYTIGMKGTYNVFEAARQAGVKQIIYASTIQVSGWNHRAMHGMIDSHQPVHPTSLYAAGKVFGESLGQVFVKQYGMTIVCLRIGAFADDPRSMDERFAKVWCSPRDLAQLVQRSLEHTNLGFQVFYAISDNTHRCFDISNAQSLLGYAPQDNADHFLARD